MGDSGNDLEARLSEAQNRISEHPGYKEYQELLALETSIKAVFAANLRELMNLLQAASVDGELAIELIQNVRPPIVRERFQAVVTQRLHNYLASGQSLVDHVRRLMRDRTGKIAQEFDRRKSELLSQNPEVRFMADLRNYTLHRRLPFLGYRLSMTEVNTDNPKMESEVELSVAQLMEWDGWSAESKRFLEQCGEAVVLRPIVEKHGMLLLQLNSWLHSELALANDAALDEVNKLVVDANAILTGGDREEAERVSRRYEMLADEGEQQ